MGTLRAFRKGFRSGLKKAGADSEAIEYLLGHSQGLIDTYTDPDALPLREAVDKIPALGELDGEGNVIPLRKTGAGEG